MASIRGPLLVALLLLGLAVIPYTWIESGLTCAVKMALGIDCPGCGLLRSWHLLLHGDWAGGVALYPLAPLLLIGMLTYLLARFAVSFQRGQSWSLRMLKMSRGASKLLVFFIAVQWIAKLIGVW